MIQTRIKILTVFLTTFFFYNLAHSQSIEKDKVEINTDRDIQKKESMMADSLNGTWLLMKTIRYENGETIIQEPSTQLWLTPGAKPFTTIKIGSLRNFEIEQSCMKCPYLFWKGQYEVETHEDNGFFYLHFVDNRMIDKKEVFKLEFNGHLINFENGELTLKDKEGTEWVYKRQ